MFPNLYKTVLKPFSSDMIQHHSGLGTSVSLTYLGTAGFVFSSKNRKIVVDPYVSRPSLLAHTKRLQSDVQLVEQYIPQADDVLVGHSHHDHILDAPCLCKSTGARLIGSPDVIRVGRAAGVPESQLLSTEGREDILCGDTSFVRGIPSIHGRVFTRVPLPGTIPDTFTWPAFYWQFKHGLVLNWLIEMDGLRILHVDSADFLEREWNGLEVDVLCLCAIRRESRPNFIEDAIRLTKPKVVMACHWDCFWIPMDAETQYCLPGVHLNGFVDEVKEQGVQPMVMGIGDSVIV